MIISNATATRLIKQGKARMDGHVAESNGDKYAILTRYDLQRTDHTRDDEGRYAAEDQDGGR